MGKRRKKRIPEIPEAAKRHCPRCNTRIVLDAKQRRWLMVWAYRVLQGPTCCDGVTLPADHWHGGCQQCGHRWIEPHTA